MLTIYIASLLINASYAAYDFSLNHHRLLKAPKGFILNYQIKVVLAVFLPLYNSIVTMAVVLYAILLLIQSIYAKTRPIPPTR
jgi:EamA domain-containing membrane protein RarD